MREFNVTGLCVPGKHYMADVSDKLNWVERRGKKIFDVIVGF